MSDDVKCDFCGKRERRTRMHPAPPDWFYLEAKDDEDSKPEETVIIVYACSQECALSLWKKGPGPRWPAEQMSLDGLGRDGP